MRHSGKRAAALFAIVGALVGAGLGVWQPRVSVPDLSRPAMPGEDERAISPLLTTPLGRNDREPVGASRADGLRLVLRTNAVCGQEEHVPVTVVTEDASESRMMRVGEPSSWSFSGVVRIEAGGFGWLPSSRIVELDGVESRDVVLDVVPRTLLFGRVLDALNRTPIEVFNLRLESTLEQPNGGSHVYVGSPSSIVSTDGFFCRVLLQDGSSNRLTLDAAGYEAHRTEWMPVNPGDPWDVGDVLLTPVAEEALDVQVLDAVSGSPVRDAAVFVASTPFAAEDLVLAGKRIAFGPLLSESKAEAARTDADGAVQLRLPAGKPFWVAAWKAPYQLQICEQAPLMKDPVGQSKTLRIELLPGPRIEGVLLIGPDLAAVVQSMHIEVQSDGARRQLSLDVLEPSEPIPFVVEGLSPGPVELWVVARELGSEVRPRRTLIATEALVLSGTKTHYLQIDCGVAFGNGVVHGGVTLPAGQSLVSCRAFVATDRRSPVASRTVPVHENRFVISGCATPRALLGIQGFDSSAAVQLLWIGEVDTSNASNQPLSIDVARSVIHGHAGDVSHLAMEEVLVSPVGDHPFVGVPLATVAAYPGSDGEFTIYGLSPGTYRAVALNSQLEAEFRVGSGSVDVHLTKPMGDRR